MFSIIKTVICEFHFEITEIRVSLGMGRKTLVHGSILSLFKFRKRENMSSRKSPRKRICFVKNQTERDESQVDNPDSDNDINFDIDESGENFNCAQ